MPIKEDMFQSIDSVTRYLEKKKQSVTLELLKSKLIPYNIIISCIQHGNVTICVQKTAIGSRYEKLC